VPEQSRRFLVAFPALRRRGSSSHCVMILIAPILLPYGRLRLATTVSVDSLYGTPRFNTTTVRDRAAVPLLAGPTGFGAERFFVGVLHILASCSSPRSVVQSTSSSCICVTTSLTNPLIALWTSEGFKVSVIPVQTSSPSGAVVT
jgi:hypothetical protein